MDGQAKPPTALRPLRRQAGQRSVTRRSEDGGARRWATATWRRPEHNVQRRVEDASSSIDDHRGAESPQARSFFFPSASGEVLDFPIALIVNTPDQSYFHPPRAHPCWCRSGDRWLGLVSPLSPSPPPAALARAAARGWAISRCMRKARNPAAMTTVGGLSPTVVLCVLTASSFSFLLGYDIGIMSGAKRLIAREFDLVEHEARAARRRRRGGTLRDRTPTAPSRSTLPPHSTVCAPPAPLARRWSCWSACSTWSPVPAG